MPYTPASPSQTASGEILNRINFMNTNTIQVVSIPVAIGFIAGFTAMGATGNLLTSAAIGVSYLAAAALVAMAASDYRSRPKSYSAAPVVTGSFRRSVISIASRTPTEKRRMAA
jgi:hypothetical protein